MTGNLTSLQDSRRIGAEIAQSLLDEHIDGAFLVSL